MSKKTSILFLDDDPALLSGLERRLKPFRSVWDMRFESSPIYALETFEENPCDVVVTDVSMPVISGDTVANLFGSLPSPPAIVVLSGQFSKEELESRITVPFEYLSKPCDPVALVMAVARLLNATAPRISALYDEVLEVVVRKMRQNGMLNIHDLPDQYVTLMGIHNVSAILGEIFCENGMESDLFIARD